jgi:4-hydroxy-tetrahydrodipicolinate synthase
MFEGLHTAIVTPFRGDGGLDEEAFRGLIEAQIAAGVDGIVPVGTTGESPTLSMDEHARVVELAVQTCAGRVKVIAGTGANSTAEALELTRQAKEAGADGSLQVTPYYNKPMQSGLAAHFSAAADVGLPVVLYNVPGRTSREIEVATIAELSAHPNIVAVKEAGGSVERVSRILDCCDITVLSGDDALTLPMIAVGGEGVISVASNVAPAEVGRMVQAARAGNLAEARELHRRLYPLFTALFWETNPIPVKAALAMLGRIAEVYRPPLGAMEAGRKRALHGVLAALGLPGSE